MSKVERIFPDQVISLYAGLPVRNYKAALTWYEQLLGCPPTFLVSDIEAVWELAEHRLVFIEKMPKRAGHALHTIFICVIRGHSCKVQRTFVPE